MNSSIFTSERASWPHLLRCYAIACLILACGLSAILLGFDPYDTGRLALLPGYGVPHFGPRLTAASLARQPDVEAAIFGNSTSQLLDPSRLSELTRERFVSLTIPGTGPIEQLTIADWFLRHHRGAASRSPTAVVFGLDTSWCEGDGRLVMTNPFPFWLYSDSLVTYSANMLRLKTFEAVARKLDLVLGRSAPLRSDGYNDYEAGRQWDDAAAAREFAHPASFFAVPEKIEFAAVPRLQGFLAALPAETEAVLVFVPRHHSALPPPGSPLEQAEVLCKAAYRSLVAARPKTAVLDFLVDGDIARDDRAFWDQIHYRHPVARLIEDDIAAALATGAVAR